MFSVKFDDDFETYHRNVSDDDKDDGGDDEDDSGKFDTFFII